MDVLLALPKQVFGHAMRFYEPRSPSAKVMGDFMQHMRTFHDRFDQDCRECHITDTCTYYDFFEEFTTRELRSQLKHQKPVLTDWLICQYHYGGFHNEDLTCATRDHFSRLGQVWDTTG